jgi:hypothetical protein
MDEGTLGILNVGAGDTRLVFDENNPADSIRAARIVKDMIRRGYALLVEVDDGQGGKTFTRATDFDANTYSYIIADFDPVQAAQVDEETETGEASEASETGEAAETGEAETETPRRRRRSIPASETRGVAVARSAGG